MPEEFLNNKMFGIEMGASISDLSQAINIHYSNVNTTHYGASCVSWDGKGNQTWTADGCQTNQTNGYVNCRCSHNTFIAVVMTLKPEMTFTKNSSCVDPKDAV
ncbi:adhesion G protein-coupled receptor G3-like [Poecilia latipinna]|nr:PREDICTED: adhesion G protein-coupled receptor G3-like [Poecilia mexicana]XP_014891133.1 PREDICTED: adhesion G protein-coupled receptor G3-like [Poecilia latipinna]